MENGVSSPVVDHWKLFFLGLKPILLFAIRIVGMLSGTNIRIIC